MDDAPAVPRVAAATQISDFATPDEVGVALIARGIRVTGGDPRKLERLTAGVLVAYQMGVEQARFEKRAELKKRLPDLDEALSRSAPGRGVEDAFERAIDLLLGRIGTEARRLLWILSLSGGRWVPKDLVEILFPSEALDAQLAVLHETGLLARREGGSGSADAGEFALAVPIQ